MARTILKSNRAICGFQLVREEVCTQPHQTLQSWIQSKDECWLSVLCFKHHQESFICCCKCPWKLLYWIDSSTTKWLVSDRTCKLCTWQAEVTMTQILQNISENAHQTNTAYLNHSETTSQFTDYQPSSYFTEKTVAASQIRWFTVCLELHRLTLCLLHIKSKYWKWKMLFLWT